MHKIEFPEINKSFEFPSDMYEITDKDYLFFLNQVILSLNGKFTFDQILIQMAYRMVLKKHNPHQVNGYLYSENDRDSFYINLKQIADLFEFLVIIRDVNGEKVFEPNRCIRNFLPKIGKYYGPDDALQNISIIEYIHADNLFKEYYSTEDEKYLDELIATLYRPKKWFIFFRKWLNIWDGDYRQTYNESSVEARAKKISNIKPEFKLACKLFFHACDDYIKSGKIQIGNAEIDLSILFITDSDRDNNHSSDDIGMIGILYKVAETGVFGGMQTASKQNLYDFLLKLYQNRKEYIDNKPKYKSNENQS